MIQLTAVDKVYGHQLLFTEATMQLNPGEKVGLVGPNGSGKTTLFRMITGEDTPDSGEVSCAKGVTIGYFRQDAGDMAGRSTLDEVIAGSGRLGELHYVLAELERALADPDHSDQSMEKVVERFGHVQDEYQQLGGYELEARAMKILHGLGFTDVWIHGDVGALSGGWKMRVSMAQALLGDPNVLLLDEPTNHLDIESIIWLEGFLRDSQSALLMTSHDRDFMNRVVTRIIEVDGGELRSYSGNYDFYEQEAATRVIQRQAAFDRQQAMLSKEQRFIDRFNKHAAKAGQVQSRMKKLDKIERVVPPRVREVVSFDFARPPRSGEDVAVLRGVSKGFGSQVIYDGFDFTIHRGERWCVMGENGAGKTTLLEMVAGVLDPDAGTVRLGASLKLGYFAQQALDLLDPALTVWEHIDRDFPLANTGTKRTLLGAFQFPGDDIQKPVRVLSGGERSRLVLARMLFDPPNFLVLDEPTNHLDLLTKEMLIRALSTFDGTMLFVSHDRAFLRGIANKVLDLSGGDGVGRRPVPYHHPYRTWVERTGHEAPGVRN